MAYKEPIDPSKVMPKPSEKFFKRKSCFLCRHFTIIPNFWGQHGGPETEIITGCSIGKWPELENGREYHIDYMFKDDLLYLASFAETVDCELFELDDDFYELPG